MLMTPNELKSECYQQKKQNKKKTLEIVELTLKIATKF